MSEQLKQKHLNIMFKTVSEDCNLGCDYCYYSSCNGQDLEKRGTVSLRTIEKMIKEYMLGTNGIASFIWQGGEPLLAGLNFFERVISFQLKYAPPHTQISNSIQTNGTLITPKVAKFFKKYAFIVGVSVDGPSSIHDKRRTYRNGKDSHHDAMKGIAYLRIEGVSFNIITVVHEDNVKRVDELFEFYLKERFEYIQFIPCMDFKSQDSSIQAKFLISPQEYGNFLCQAFDKWFNEGKPQINVHHFVNLYSIMMGHPSHICFFSESCSSTIILEANGNVFPCDFYIDEKHKLGNIVDTSLKTMLESELMSDFHSMKNVMSESCRKCDYRNLCNGGCPRNRKCDFEELNGKDYFCESYQMLFRHSISKIEKLIKANQ